MAQITARWTFACLLASTLAAATTLSAAQPDTRRDPRAIDPKEGKQLFQPKDKGDTGAAANPPSANDTDWVIVLAAFRGDEAARQAELALARISAVPALHEAMITRRGAATIIALGRFPDPAAPAAQDRLRQVRELVVDRERPFTQAMLAPPADAGRGSRPEYNLLQARSQFGKAAAVSLQVGVYARDDIEKPTEADLAEIRRQAEQAAVDLRREGEMAFYYHGPRRSMVTIGVFTEDDLGDAAKGLPINPELAALRKRFPFNLYNGQGIRQRFQGKGEGKMQTSQTVRIPDR